jgi:predicted site-specific integrase-resolvase
MTEEFMNQTRLATRWQISPRTLERWRWRGEGPAFTKIGGRVVYRVTDVQAYETGRRCESTLQSTALRGAQ